MRNENRRPWWKKLVILLSGPAVMVVVILVVFAIYERNEPEPSAEQWDSAVSDAFIVYVAEYVIPVNSVRGETPSCNEKTLSSDAIETCERLVRTLDQKKRELTLLADRFDALADGAPTDIPAEWKQSLYDMSRVLRSMQEADSLVVTAWSTRDKERWARGWRQRSEAIGAIPDLSADAEDMP